MHDRIEVAPGVFRRVQQSRAVYCGDADDLQAAGLITQDMLPGQHGNPRGMCSYLRNGTRVKRGAISQTAPGHTRIVQIKGKGGTFFEVWVLLSAQRLEAIDAERAATRNLPAIEIGAMVFAGLQSSLEGVAA
ncbi:hypothetical protein [Pseudorhodoferax sp. Leaf274]|uniref:hypothetical protein n=1 Tax=Pseudorhodoferax sp. Leaf274 TaxID=1736318 RepID=UPI0007037249|nr:hypothetical protein [Pseudorhodoferax sp. Leaf274]KQP43950.1 hypothetical protein ASF44_28905 [Pseudorhodoferax sp. Leaf274]